LTVESSFLTLGIETSCDDTAVCVLENQRTVLAQGLSSQIEEHAPFGGVVPEVASRCHQEVLLPLLQRILEEAGVRNPARQLSLVAVTAGPGLVGSLLVGVMSAKALAQAWEVPLVGVNHLEGHLFANVATHPSLEPPFLSLIVSGGHTEIVFVRSFGEYELLGETKDDAVGEAYDKVAKLLGLGYPGGPVVDRLAREGDPDAFPFPVPLEHSDEIGFSFSGLKTAVLWVLRRLEREGKPIPAAHVCASFQKAAVASLVGKIRLAVLRSGVRRVAVSGGVAANSALRSALGALPGVEIFLPPPSLCTDNAVMIAAAGYNIYRRGFFSDLSLSPDPALPLTH
jgi:N6-L-threonylcarbamoyladenine synthase